MIGLLIGFIIVPMFYYTWQHLTKNSGYTADAVKSAMFVFYSLLDYE